MNELDLRIIELKLTNPCFTDAQIANQLGVSRQTISRRRNSEGFKDEVRRIRNENASNYGFLLVKAMARLSELIDNENPRIALSACNLICTSIFPIPEPVKGSSLDSLFDKLNL